MPEHAGELLCVFVDKDVDDFHFQGMLEVNAKSFDWLDGRLDTGTYFDILEHYGISPLEFVEPVTELYLAGF
jgi:hypothetical protein